MHGGYGSSIIAAISRPSSPSGATACIGMQQGCTSTIYCIEDLQAPSKLKIYAVDGQS